MKKYLIFFLLLFLLLNLSGCSPTPTDPANAVWLSLESGEEFLEASRGSSMGKVVISDALETAMDSYPSDTVFAVAVCFAPMVDDDVLADLSSSEKTEYYNSLYEKASQSCDRQGITTSFPPGACWYYCFFYAYATKAQLHKLTCSNDVSMYVAATPQYK